MPMAVLKKYFTALVLACCAFVVALSLGANAAEEPPLGAWRTTNQCFLALFYVSEDGSVQAAYLSGEHEDDATWSWDGMDLSITSPTFTQDSFTAHIADDGLEADYVWHDLEKDELHSEHCLFEKVMPDETSA
jgi:hypothetical protein